MALFKNSANIIVQNRMTGQLEEEKMQVYVRLGIRLLYKARSSDMNSHIYSNDYSQGAKSRMEGARGECHRHRRARLSDRRIYSPSTIEVDVHQARCQVR